MTQSGPVLLIDGPNILQRAVHAAQSGRVELSADGVPTAALLIFINTLSRHIRAERPSAVVVCWDGGSSPARLALHPGYKAGRGSDHSDDSEDTEYGLAYRFLALANIQQVKFSGVEADDLIAKYSAHVADGETLLCRGSSGAVILSGDKDFLQLLDFRVEIALPNDDRRRTFLWFHDEYGFWPSQYAMVKAMMGDPGDAVDGIRGIGPKKAAKVGTDAEWEIDAVLANPLIAPHADLVLRNLKLVDLRNIYPSLPPIPSVQRWEPTNLTSALWPQLRGFLDQYQLASVRNRLESGVLWCQDQPQGADERWV